LSPSQASQHTLFKVLPGVNMPVFSRIAVLAQVFSVILAPVLAASVSQEYDYVIIGGGITGLVVANRLSEDKSSTLH
jgi:hypothetical protein